MKCCLYDIYNYLDQYLLIKEFINLFKNDTELLSRIIKNNDEKTYNKLYPQELETINRTKPLCEIYLTKDINKQNFDKEIEALVNNYASQESQRTEFIAN